MNIGGRWLKRRRSASFGLAAMLAVGACGSALAHHSAAMFDATKTVKLVGSVKQLAWTNPHAWLYVIVPGEGSAPAVEWSIEFSSINHMQRQGLRPSMLKPGDKVTVNIAPLKDGSPGGQFRNMIMPDGKPFGRGV